MLRHARPLERVEVGRHGRWLDAHVIADGHRALDDVHQLGPPVERQTTFTPMSALCRYQDPDCTPILR